MYQFGPDLIGRGRSDVPIKYHVKALHEGTKLGICKSQGDARKQTNHLYDENIEHDMMLLCLFAEQKHI